jgi:hypothetical protein
MLSLHRLAKTEQNSFVEMDSQWSTLMGVDSSTCLIISYSPDAPAHEAYHFHEEGGIPVVAAFHFLLWNMVWILVVHTLTHGTNSSLRSYNLLFIGRGVDLRDFTLLEITELEESDF